MIWPALLAVVYPLLFQGPDTSAFTKVPAPGVRYRMNMATATSAPWVDSNIWRYRRDPKASYLCDVRQKSAPLAMAEGFMEGVKLSLQSSPEQKADYDAMLEFLKQIPEGAKTPWVNLTISDDGSPQAGEVLNLLSRRNIFYQVGSKADFALSSKISNPYEHMQEIREKLGDDKRVLRLFGSELTLAELARDGKRIRLHLLNYGNRKVEDLRIRIQGRFRESDIKLYVFNSPQPKLKDFVEDRGATEFTLDLLPLYAVLDFESR